MDYILSGIMEAFKLLIGFDKEVYGIVILSVFVSSLSTILSSIITVPLGIYLGIKDFKGKKIFSRILYTLMSTPSVIVGLVIAIILSRRGPLGFLDLMYSPTAMIIAQTVLVTPLILGLTYNISKNRGKSIEKIGKTLGASKLDIIILIIKELRIDILMNIVTAFSRAISEVGAVMIVGGNIKGYTRVITTSISMLNSMGDYPMAIALGIVLLIISFGINSIIYSYSMED
ncbi:putative ABC transporter permease protein [Gottschalkia acidurici 9a]|uniref:ABC transporter permease protein n=1 Tax=Gottschalkia acidurici (strain ATCC 7906 / DSM 604 / BCRC 14475 / CIP 104303 / KCTC 5404 / NCIMB 10678 / 9a) TaxID=1128398 RepID=K0B463_GOTA9|nr:ABC transporter permease [Gottschalkia acidurici]AFS79897.1 putative ABC transporter permease protein [Gottschalkia acidurici 9a]